MGYLDNKGLTYLWSKIKTKIDSIIVPTALSQLTSDSTHRTVTDTEKTAWNNKSNFSGKYSDLSNIPRISKKGQPSTSGYYLLGTLPAKGSTANYASFTLTGRFGGWETQNSSTMQIMLMNRGGISGTVSMCCTATDISRIWSVFDIVVSEDSSGVASIYLKCNNYFLYDFEWMTFDGTFLYDGTYTTTVPSNIVWQLSTAPKTILKADGSFEASGGINATQFAGKGLRIVTDENDSGQTGFFTVII